MNSFQQIVVIIATIILIICLILIGITLYNNNGKEVFPPVVASCPDYWTVSDKTCVKGSAPKGCGTPISALNDSSSRRDKCRAQKIAKECDITWDGITNNHHLCGRHDHGN